MIKKFYCDKLKVKIYLTEDIVGQQAAFECAMRIRDLLLDKENINILFSCSEKMKWMYKELSKFQDINWKNVTAFFVDSIDIKNEISEKLIEKLSFRDVYFLNSGYKNIKFVTDKLTSLFQENDIDIACLSLGCNGEIGFLKGEDANFEDIDYIKDVNINGENALALTTNAISKTKYKYCISGGVDCTISLFNTVRGEISPSCPCSYLRKLDKSIIYCDRDSAENIIIRKSLITDEISDDFEDALKLAKEFNLEAVELRRVFGKPVYQLDSAELTTVKYMLKKYNLKVSCIASWIYKCEFEEELIKNETEILKSTLEIAVELGCSKIRVYSFFAKSDFSKVDDELVELFKYAAHLAKQKNVILVLENEPKVYTTNGETVSTLVKMVNSPNFKALWDPCNDIFDPYNETPYPTGYNFIKGHYAHVHIKDVEKSGGEITAVPLGEGDYDIEGQIKSMLLEGYDGFVSFESKYTNNSREQTSLNTDSSREGLSLLHKILLDITDEM